MSRRSRRHYRNKTGLPPGYRMARVGALIRCIVAEALERIDDPRLEFVSVTGVSMNRDLGRAVVWFTTLDDDDSQEVLAAFEEHSSRLRRSIAKESKLRKTPELLFQADVAIRTAERLEKMFDDIKTGDSSAD